MLKCLDPAPTKGSQITCLAVRWEEEEEEAETWSKEEFV